MTDYLVPAILFGIGFGAALLVRRLVSGVGRRRAADLSLDKGTVRLDQVGKKKARKRRR